MKDLMIDLETLGTDPNCPVISIGAVFFDIENKKLGQFFYRVLSLDEQISRGRQVTADTIKWWMQQDEAAKKIFKEQQLAVYPALEDFISWFSINNSKSFVWGNGSTFDISIMENIFKNYGFKAPWGYNRVMDLRTFKRFKPPVKETVKVGISHNALDDAINQAQYVIDNS